MIDIFLEAADKVAAAGLEKAVEMGIEGVSVVVLDRTGAIRVLRRTDKGSLAGPDIAVAKARTALGFRVPTIALNKGFADQPAVTSAVAESTDGRFLPLGGGVPVMHPEMGAIGAVGVAGSTQENDDAIANAAVAILDIPPS